jgi:hypothetical protein
VKEETERGRGRPSEDQAKGVRPMQGRWECKQARRQEGKKKRGMYKEIVLGCEPPKGKRLEEQTRPSRSEMEYDRMADSDSLGGRHERECLSM